MIDNILKLIETADVVLIEGVESKDIKVDIYEVRNEPDNDVIRLSWEYEGFCRFITEEALEKAEVIFPNKIKLIALNNLNKEVITTFSLFSLNSILLDNSTQNK